MNISAVSLCMYRSPVCTFPSQHNKSLVYRINMTLFVFLTLCIYRNLKSALYHLYYPAARAGVHSGIIKQSFFCPVLCLSKSTIHDYRYLYYSIYASNKRLILCGLCMRNV